MIFKAWDNKNKRWVESFFINQIGEVYGFGVDTTHSYQMGACVINRNHLIDATLCRSTGLKDKHGVEIFENDIIKSLYSNHLVRYNDGCFEINIGNFCDNYVRIYQHYLDINGFEIAGNIFEHENLLKEKQ